MDNQTIDKLLKYLEEHPEEARQFELELAKKEAYLQGYKDALEYVTLKMKESETHA